MTADTPPERTSAPQQLTALDEISDLLTASSFNLDTLLDQIVRITAEMLEVKGCTVRLYDRDSGEMHLKAVYGLSNRFITKGPVIAEKSVYQEMVENYEERGEIVEIFDVRSDPRVQYTDEAIAEGIQSLLATPLLRNNRVIGALSVFTDRKHRFSDTEIQTFRTIANQAATAIHLAQIHQRELELQRIEQELEIASDIQAQLMPPENPAVPGYDIAGINHPSQEVGGDFYDFIELDGDRLGIAVGDVSGKGIPAALLMVTVRTSLRVQAENVRQMSEVIKQGNRTLHQYSHKGEFATVFYATLDPEKRELTYVNAGHNFPLLVRKQETTALQTGGIPLGFFPDMDFTQQSVSLEPGDVMVIYTDGITEATNAEGEQFGENRLLQLVQEFRYLTAEKLAALIHDRAKQFLGEDPEYTDDRTVVVLKVNEED